jgi:hypothetical protein
MPERDSVLLAEAEPLTIFSNKKMNKDTYRVKFYIESYGSGSNPQRGYYILMLSLDESYYKYQKQLYLYEMSAYEGLGSSPQTYPLFSNVTNGLGIFTSYSVYRKSVVE